MVEQRRKDFIMQLITPNSAEYRAFHFHTLPTDTKTDVRRKIFLQIFSQQGGEDNSHYSPGDYSIVRDGSSFRVRPDKHEERLTKLLEDDVVRDLIDPVLPEWMDLAAFSQYIEIAKKADGHNLDFVRATVDKSERIYPWFTTDQQGTVRRSDYSRAFTIEQLIPK